jgi:hypothetical protein
VCGPAGREALVAFLLLRRTMTIFLDLLSLCVNHTVGDFRNF